MTQTADREIENGSFCIEQEIHLDASRERVYEALTTDIGAWWSHSFNKGESRIVLEPRVGGQFHETWGDGEGAVFGTVMFLRKPECIRLSGPLGMDTPVCGVFEFRLEEEGPAATRLCLTHRCTGELDRRWHTEYDAGWQELWGELRSYLARNGSS